MIQAAVNFSLSSILIRRFGPLGVALGTLIPAIVVEAVLLPIYTSYVLDVSVRRFYLSAVLRPVAAAGPYAVWLWFCRAQGLVRGYGSLALVIGAGLVLYAVLAWKLGLDNEDRTFIRGVLAGMKAMPART
jgi:hypothetical protein